MFLPNHETLEKIGKLIAELAHSKSKEEKELSETLAMAMREHIDWRQCYYCKEVGSDVERTEWEDACGFCQNEARLDAETYDSLKGVR